MKNNNYSPLRYPGGKSRLVNFIKSIIDQNDLKGGTYIEPFSGGAAIALALAIDGYMERIVINDYDRSMLFGIAYYIRLILSLIKFAVHHYPLKNGIYKEQFNIKNTMQICSI